MLERDIEKAIQKTAFEQDRNKPRLMQYSGLACHIPRLVHDSHQPHNTNLKEQHVCLFPFPYSVHTWDHFTFL